MEECYYRQGLDREALPCLNEAWEICRKLKLDHMVDLLMSDIFFRSQSSGYDIYIRTYIRNQINKQLQGGNDMFGFVNDPPDI